MTAESPRAPNQQSSYSGILEGEVYPLPAKDSPDYDEAVRRAAAEPRFIGTVDEFLTKRRETKEAMYHLAVLQGIPGSRPSFQVHDA
jgi:hypothetical protein